jgi:uncharacterized membrane protein YqjE
MSAERSTSDLIGDAIEQVVDVLQTDARLLRAELSEKFDQALRAVMLLASGWALLLVALFFSLGAMVDRMAMAGLPHDHAAWLVAAGAAILGAILAVVGYNSIRSTRLEPSRTFEQIRKDVLIIRARVKS